MVELQPSKLNTRVRFPSPAPDVNNSAKHCFFIFEISENNIINNIKNIILLILSTQIKIKV